MPTPLDQWQQRLEGHFQSLARARTGSRYHVFALEHDLSGEEFREVSSLLRSRLKAGLSLAPHWLLWVVYATERGYSYAGDEYWRSFEEQTPAWEFGDRYKIVPWFKKFQSAYDGVVPSGPWAGYFKIIAWPITHAILPRYLQQQFARALYDLRFRLARLNTVTPADVGRLLAANSHHASTRFQEFLQQEELTGRIVLALLGVTPADGKEPIYRPTLQRIVRDLEKVRSAREWLKETQRIVADRFTGIGHGTGPPLQRPFGRADGRSVRDEPHVGVSPTLFLRHAGAGTWSVFLEVPSFGSVAALNPGIRAFLQRTRCRLNGANDIKPAGWLLSGNRRGALKSWPDPSKPLIRFDQAHAALEHLLESECRLTSGPVWLFRVASDGTAREITGRIVRPGSNYIVVAKGELPEAHPAMTPCTLDCQGAKAIRLNIPSQVSAETTAWLHRLGLQVARTIRVWPAGLPGRGWDGEGSSEWVTTEVPCFGIVHDHPVDAYVLSLNHGGETIVKAGEVGHPVFVRLAPLSSGKHVLTVKARRSASLDALAPSPPAEGYIALTVREPEPWTPGVLSHPGFIVTLDPPEPDLDTFWRNEVSVSVVGPEAHSATISVSLEGRDGRELLAESLGGAMDLPITPDAWRKRFAQFLNHQEHAWRYLEAACGRLTINGESLGEFSQRFEHNVPPLHWVLRADQGQIILRLVDDTGEEQSKPDVLFFSMDRPLKGESSTPEHAFKGVSVAPPGGLFIAIHGAHHDTIVVSAGLTANGFEGLSVRPVFTGLRDGSVSVANALHVLELWTAARRAGFLTEYRCQQVRDGLVGAIYETLCGPEWAKAESAFRQRPSSRHAVDNLQRAIHTRGGFAAVLRRDCTRVDRDLRKAVHWYSDLAARYGLRMDPTLCKFVLALATHPDLVHRDFEREITRLINDVRSSPAILRGARFLALMCVNQGRLLPSLPSSPP